MWNANNEMNANNEKRNAPQETERKMRDYYFSGTERYGSCIEGQPIKAKSFEIKPQFISLLNNQAEFSGFPREDPNQHKVEFVDACGLMKIKGVSSDTIKLRLFKYSWRDKAGIWFQSQQSEEFTT